MIGRRADGYHELESLVVFADCGDRLTFTPGGALSLAVSGPTAAQAGDGADNLVLKAARALAERETRTSCWALSIWKRISRSPPVSAAVRPTRRRRCG